MRNEPESHEDWARETEKVKETERIRAAEQEIGIIELRGALDDTKYELSSIKYALDEAAIIAVTDTKGTITYVNKKFCELSKYTTDELIGQNHRIINSGHHTKEFFKEMYRTIGSGSTWKGQIKNRAKDGTYYWVDTTIVPLKNTDGKLTKYLAIRFDITAQKLLEEKLKKDKERYEAIVEISEAFATVATVNKNIIDFIAKKLSEVLGGAIVIRLISEEDKSLKVLAYYHKDEKIREIMSDMVLRNSFPINKGIYGEVIKTGKPVLIPATEKSEINRQTEPALLELLDTFDISSAVIVPLLVMNRVLGVVSLTHFTPGQSYTQEDQTYLLNIASKIALGISHAGLHKQNQAELEKRKKIEEELLDYKQHYFALFNNKTICIVHGRIITNKQGTPYDFEILQVNDAYESITGIKKETVEGKRILEVAPNIRNFKFDYIASFGKVALENAELNFEVLSETTQKWYSYYVYSPKPREFTLIFTDVTERKKTEQALSESQRKLIDAQRLAQVGSFSIDLESGLIEWTDEMFNIFEIDPGSGVPTIEIILSYVHPDEQQNVASLIAPRINTGTLIIQDTKLLLPSGNVKYVKYIDRPVNDSSGKVIKRVGAVKDTTEMTLIRLQLEEALKNIKEKESSLIEAQKLAHLGSFSIDVNSNIYVWSEEMFNIYGLDPKAGSPTFEEAISFIHPEDRDNVILAINKAAESRQEIIELEYRIVRKDGEIVYLHNMGKATFNSEGKPVKRFGTILDITDRKLAEIKLKKTLGELERSNKELEQFAYVASHDLQEPLRMVSNYVTLLSQRYENKLDDTAKEFISFAVDGAKRMGNLIKDLLIFSRLTTRANPFEQVDLNLTIVEILQDLKLLINESKAEISFGQMPIVNAEKIQMWQLFKNLIINGIKFNTSKPPVIKIKAEIKMDFWQFSVSDNGIGIEKEYFERIFMIFQRLHERDKFPGTGIGLAVCQKIVERHGGRIWVESEEGRGSKFYFTISASIKP